jgi:hypothetical protein
LQEVDTGGSKSSSATREEKVAEILVNRKKYDYNLGFGRDIAGIVYDGANIAIELLTVDESKMPELLELVFNVWVDKLLYAATKCSPESHAKQLSRGGDLTTIVWIMAQHAGPFRIGHWGPDADDDDEMHVAETLQYIYIWSFELSSNEVQFYMQKSADLNFLMYLCIPSI